MVIAFKGRRAANKRPRNLQVSVRRNHRLRARSTTVPHTASTSTSLQSGPAALHSGTEATTSSSSRSTTSPLPPSARLLVSGFAAIPLLKELYVLEVAFQLPRGIFSVFRSQAASAGVPLTSAVSGSGSQTSRRTSSQSASGGLMAR